MKIQMWSVDESSATNENPQRNEHAVEKVAASIEEFGMNKPRGKK